jgi:DNA replication and repair protein RecF
VLSKLRLQNFRSYSDNLFEFSPGINVIVGPNASGKTNLLEAALIIARGKSYRARDSDLIQFNKSWASLEANLANGSKRAVKIKLLEKADKTHIVDGKDYKRLTLNHSLPMVLFEPNHLLLLSGGPERRRDYLDDIIEQTVANYSKLRSSYKRALAQRNALLKQRPGNIHSQVFPWNVRLSEFAGQIIRRRYELTEKINTELSQTYKHLSNTKDDLKIVYEGGWAPDSYESNLLKELERNIENDKLKGFTSAGPHREDIKVLFNGHVSQEVASRGENRTAILALKVIELKSIEEHRSIKPILLLDDVFSELDNTRRSALVEYVASHQVLITSTEADLANKAHLKNTTTIELK